MQTTNVTPMLRQYNELKQQYPGTLLFFRLGDFYELFFDDAITGSRELEITLTARHKEHGAPVPMCGVPHHAAAPHIARLVRKGYRVAICEQTEDASKTKKLVRREVVRVITPGTAVDPQLLDSREPVYLGAVCGTGKAFGAAFLDLSTGEFRSTEAAGTDSWDSIREYMESYAPRELLFPVSLTPLINQTFLDSQQTEPLPLAQVSEGDEKGSGGPARPMQGFLGSSPITLTPLDEWLWQFDQCASVLREQFGVRELSGYGLEGKDEAVRAAGVCLRYARETQRAFATHINDLTYVETHDHLVLDAVTLRNLELTEGQQASGRTHTLFNVIDCTATAMGTRLLRSWLLRPSVRRGEIEARLKAVEVLHSSEMKRDRLRSLLKNVADLERLIGRLPLGSTTPRDLSALRRSLEQVPSIRDLLMNEGASSLIQILCEAADDLPAVRGLIARAIVDDPPATIAEGGVVRPGYSPELDELRSTSRDAKQTIATLETRERKRTGISSLRVRFNHVFGYFIEVTRANAARVPPDYQRRQTLANAERFTTPELKEWEERVLGAEDRMIEMEAALFAEVRSEVAVEIRKLQATARALASLDCLAALAETAARRRYLPPFMHDGDEIEIKGGRHPVIEGFNPDPFVPNDLYLNNSTDRLLIITGPNLGGKSTILRQAALIQILAQMGSFVPATSARLPVVDRIWTRVGASDDLSRGRSTFMVEMLETATILHNATPRSLVLLDEIGRGTSTFDGLSIAWAVAEFLHNSAEHAAKTLFATHYHELTELAERLPGAQNYEITVAERDGEVVFLHRLERGRASKSYGIEVAKLAGMPFPVLERARDVLRRLERYELDVFAEDAEQPEGNNSKDLEGADLALDRAAIRLRRRRQSTQQTLFDAVNQNIINKLLAQDVKVLSPEEAHKLIFELQNKIV